MRTGTHTHGRSAGSIIAASLGGIKREMQRLDYAVECAGRGTDAASEERKMENDRARRESEREQRELAEKAAHASREYVGEPEREDSGIEESDNTNTNRSKNSYGKGD
jgi:hypothetical protein